MGQKVNPIGFRLCVNKNWNSRWYTEKSYAETLKEDLDIQYFVKNRLKKASISKIEVERASKKTKINIFTAKPGIIIGRKGDEVERIRKSLLNKFKKCSRLLILFILLVFTEKLEESTGNGKIDEVILNERTSCFNKSQKT